MMENARRYRHLAPGEVVQGEKVYLRAPRIDELSFVRRLWADPDTMAPVGGTLDLPEPKARKWFSRMVVPGSLTHCYCLIFNQEGIAVGEISFHRWDPEQRSARLNLKVLASYRGQGYAKDALGAFLARFFGRIGGRLMTDDVALDNHPGQRLLSSFGFHRDDRVSELYRMVMAREAYVSRYGEPGGTVEPTPH
jgi:RimJ/RimL family protein N-acetyltransferase